MQTIGTRNRDARDRSGVRASGVLGSLITGALLAVCASPQPCAQADTPPFATELFGTNISRFAAGDIDGDGDLDVVIAAGSAEILLNDGNGRLSPGGSVDFGYPVLAVVLAHADGDAHLDLGVTGGIASAQFAWASGDGSATFGTPVGTTAGLPPGNALSVGDANGDTFVDLLFGTYVVPGDGAGGFGAGFGVPLGDTPLDATLVDLDGDGHQDLVTADFGDGVGPGSSGGSVSVALSNGSGFFVLPGTLYPIPHAGFDAAVADLDGNGTQDILSAHGQGGLWMLMGDGLGGFSAPVQVPAGPASATSIDLADVNADGFPDALLGSGSKTTAVMLADGNGGLLPAVDHFVGNASTAVRLLDLSGDGVLDIVTANSNGLALARGEGAGQFATFNQPELFDELQAIARGDLDGDGHLDVVTVGDDGVRGRLIVLLGDGAGQLVPSFDLDLAPTAVDVALGDVDGDGDLDAVTAHGDGDLFSLAIGDGAGGFATPLVTNAGAPVHACALADVDGDGDRDLVLAGDALGLELRPGDGEGAFGTPTAWSWASDDLLLADVDGDGDLDALGTFEDDFDLDHSVLVRTNDGAGDFAGGITAWPVPARPAAIVVTDLDADGHADLVTANDSPGSVSVLRGDGAGGFGASTEFAHPASGSLLHNAIEAADINRDGHLDLVSVSGVRDSVTVWYGDGSAGFDDVREFQAGNVPVDLTRGDFDENGMPDLVTVDRGVFVEPTTLSVLLNLGEQGPWFDLGQGLGGTHGTPLLDGLGSLTAGEPLTLTLSGALENSVAWLVIGIAELNAAFKGGVLVPDPSPPGLTVALPVDGAGQLTVGGNWPAGVPSGFVSYYQAWIVDGAGPLGFAASHAVRATTP